MFITTTLIDWKHLFGASEIRDNVLDILLGCTTTATTALLAYCIMPNHVHLIAGHNEGGPGLSRFVGGFKSLVSRRLFPNHHGIWIRRFDDVILVSENVFLTKLAYIHENPVRAGLARTSTEWKWSSAQAWLQEQPQPGLTLDWSWMVSQSPPPEGGWRAR
jgi:putative transposase